MIELHCMVSGNLVLVNVNAISCVMERDEDRSIVIYTVCSEDDYVCVSESYNEVKNLIGKVVMVVS